MIDLRASIMNYSVSRIVALVSIVILKWQYRSTLKYLPPLYLEECVSIQNIFIYFIYLLMLYSTSAEGL